MAENTPQPFSPEDMVRRRRRSVAIGLALGLLVVVFFVTTIVRLGEAVAQRAL